MDGLPGDCKGANQHASFGITGDSVVHTPEDVAERVRFLRHHFADDALIEPFLDTREFQVGVWGNDHPRALPPSEIVYSMFTEIRDRLHTAARKRDTESRGFKEIQMPCPAPTDRPDWRGRIEEVAVKAYKVLGLRDYARFDLRMLGDEPQILDVNSNPELDVTSGGGRGKGERSHVR